MAQAHVTLPPMPAPIGNFIPTALAGGLLYLSGQAPLDKTGQPMRGKVGLDVSPEEARHRAGRVAATLLGLIGLEPGRLLRVRRVVRLFGMVNATADFTAAHEVMDGCSEVLDRLFPGSHARTDVVLPALPNNITVEVEAIFEMAPN